jgi:hypothetical protein
MVDRGIMFDEAINELVTEDREAIALRFFEQSDFRSLGECLGIKENTARMRVTRALDKLHVLLKIRGVTFPAVALGTVLGSEAVTVAGRARTGIRLPAGGEDDARRRKRSMRRG